jgi:hypothetical protein
MKNNQKQTSGSIDIEAAKEKAQQAMKKAEKKIKKINKGKVPEISEGFENDMSKPQQPGLGGV